MLTQFKKFINKYQGFSEPVKASVWYTICNVLNKGIALLATPIFTRIMTEEQYGSFAVFQSWHSIILIFTSLNIFLGGYTKGLLLYREDRERFTSACLGLTTTITCAFGIIYLSNVEFWTKVFDIPPILMAAMFVELTVTPAIEFWAAKERFDFKYKKFVLVSVITSLLSLGGGSIAVILSSYKLEARVFSDVIAKAIFATIIFVSIFIRGKTFFEKKYWLYSLRFNIPLLPHYLSNYVLNQSDRVMISRMAGKDKAGYYSVAYTISMMMNLIVNAINNSLNPYIFKAIDSVEQGKDTYENVKQKIRSVTTPLFILVAALCMIAMVFAPEVIYIFAGKKYAEAIYVIPPIAASCFFIFLYAMFSTIEYYFQESAKIALATTICALTNLVLNYVFINIFGYYAAGYTTLVCYICLALFHYLFYKKVLKGKLKGVSALYDTKSIVCISAALLLVMVVMSCTYSIWAVRYSFIAIIILTGVIKRKRLLSIFETIMRKER